MPETTPPAQQSPKNDMPALYDKEVRQHWDETTERRYFAVVDVIRLLTRSKNPAVYWRVLKKRLIAEGGNETVTKCNALKLRAADGKIRLTDVADDETLLRIVQSVPSPNAEPVKRWLARVGHERIEEIRDPEKAIHRAVETYARKGYDDEWIGRRMRSIEVRNELTREWQKRNIGTSVEFAILTNDVYQGWSGMTSREYKRLKGLEEGNLRDHMTPLELVLNMLAEASTAEIARTNDAQGMKANRAAAQKGASIAGNARNELEQTTGKPVVTPDNFLPKPKEGKELE